MPVDARSNGVPDQPLLDAVLAYLSDEATSRCATAWKYKPASRTFTILPPGRSAMQIFLHLAASPKRAATGCHAGNPPPLGELLSLDDIIAAIAGVRRISCPHLRRTSSVQMVNSRCIGVDLQ
jgi:hypothetical protein